MSYFPVGNQSKEKMHLVTPQATMPLTVVNAKGTDRGTTQSPVTY